MRVNGTKWAVLIGVLCVCVMGGTFVVQSLSYAKANHVGKVVAKEPDPRPREEIANFTRVEPKDEPLGFAISHHPAVPADSSKE